MATIAQNLARLQTARTAIANAITAKGGTVNNGDGFEQFPADIASIPSGGGNLDEALNSTKPRLVNSSERFIPRWTAKTWTGLTNFIGRDIWTDGTDIYYSNYSVHYVLNKSTSTWTAKTWTGLTSFNGSNIWTDGTDIYYSSSSNQYVLDKATSTWTKKTWSGLTSFDGSYVWTDGTDIYYSSSTTQYVLDKSTSTWTAKTWTGLTSLYGSDIWTDGTDIYYSNYSVYYVMVKIPASTVSVPTVRCSPTYTQ